ncbi:FAD-dependent oxidoreductase [Acetivibrio cellulolyticus]|uniref:FAD-dependent oxidoreductase n=1 Tax=Acetivibrio cellulolyticus TaxID=35830 RepID=UPI0001E2BD9A|nr:FAD-dependent oxidoreductase [Acetivibrio cellulolyticus]
MKILIIGAVAAGTSAAAKARRNSEDAQIKIFEMDSDISYSGCGLPYYIGNEIEGRDKLVPRNAAFFKSKYNVDILTKHKVLGINTDEKSLKVINLETSEVFVEKYDKLVIATGARPILPPIKGIDKANVFTLRNVESADNIKSYIQNNNPKRALVIGSGFIGLEMVENLENLGIEVSVVEMEDHLMKPLDIDVSVYLKDALLKKGVKIYLDSTVVELQGDMRTNTALLKDGAKIDTDLVIVATGIKPNVELAKEAGIELGVTGAIKVNEKMETSIKGIYACGDCAESYSLITGKPIYRPLGSTANKMGRIAGDSLTGYDLNFRGILGTGIFKIFDYTIAQTGLTEREALEEGFNVSVCHNIKPDKPEYFHGEEMVIKAVADRHNGRLLGVQIFGKSGVDKRIDVFATALTFGAKVQDLFHLDLAYAPPFSTTKDPVMYTGMILTNDIERDRNLISASELSKKINNNEEITIIDARVAKQYNESHVEGAINVPHERLRDTLESLDKDKSIVTYCNKGVTGNAAQNILINSGFKKVYNLSGGYKNYSKTVKNQS